MLATLTNTTVLFCALAACARSTGVATPHWSGGSLHGVVYDAQTHEPLIGVTVIANGVGNGTDAAVSDEVGHYQFEHLSDGAYQLDFYYANAKASVPTVVVGRNVAAVVDMPLILSSADLADEPTIDVTMQTLLRLGDFMIPDCRVDTGLPTNGMLYRYSLKLSWPAMCFQGIGQCARQ